MSTDLQDKALLRDGRDSELSFKSDKEESKEGSESESEGDKEVSLRFSYFCIISYSVMLLYRGM